MNYTEAKRRHRAVREASGIDDAKAHALWDACSLASDGAAATYPGAVTDTVPIDFVGVLSAANGVAAAWAFRAHWDTWDREIDLESMSMAHVNRKYAHDTWVGFIARATTSAEMERGFGWDLGSAWAEESLVNLPERTLERVRAVARLAGQMYAALRGARANRVSGVPGELHGIEVGGDIGRLLPTELMQLNDAAYETAAFARIVDRQALQYAVRGRTPANKGPLVVDLDESDSMHDEQNVRDRRTWSKAAAVALMRVAFEEKRRVAFVHFSTSVVVRVIEPGDHAGLMDMIKHFLTGGTSIGLALEESARQVRLLAQKGDAGADVVLITDGEDDRTQAQKNALEALAATGARLWILAIDQKIPPEHPLRKACVSYTHLSEEDMRSEKGVLSLAGV